MIELAFYKGDSLKDKIIKLRTKGKYSHVELIKDGYMYSSSYKDGRVRIKKHKRNPKLWDYVKLDYELNEDYIYAFFLDTIGDKYDLLGILGFVLPIQDRTDKWFCSEWVSNALKISGFRPMFKLEPYKISPNDLYRLVKDYNGTN